MMIQNISGNTALHCAADTIAPQTRRGGARACTARTGEPMFGMILTVNPRRLWGDSLEEIKQCHVLVSSLPVRNAHNRELSVLAEETSNAPYWLRGKRQSMTGV